MYFKWYKERLDTLWAPGLKIWSNGIPLKLDLYQSCANFCKYCYANEMRDMTLNRNGIFQNPQVARLVNYKALLNFFNRAYKQDDSVHPFMNWALRNKYFMEVGTTGETFQEADKYFRIAYNFFKMTSDLQLPMFINTKFNLICNDKEYLDLLINYKAPILIQATFTTVDDKLGKFYEPLAPLPSKRLETIKYLNSFDHIKVAAYISPFMPSVTNANTEEYMTKLIQAGVVGAHLRDFFIQGQTFQLPHWKKYMAENKKDLEPFPGGYHVKYDTKLKFIEEATKIAKKLDPTFKIVGMKTKFFDMESHYGKMVYDILPERFRDGIVDFTVVPILRKLKEHSHIPQMLVWDNIGYKKGKIKLPDKIQSNEGNINNLMDCGCNCNKSEVELEIPGYDWMVGGMWDGFEPNEPTGFMSEVEGIYPVKQQDGRYMKDEDGHFIYAYVPESSTGCLRSDDKQTFLLEPNISDLEDPYVPYEVARQFHIPKREGGTEDKWLTKKQIAESY